MLTIIAKVVQAFVLRTNQIIKAERSLWELNYVDSDGVLTPFISRSNIFGFLINKRNTELKWTGRWIMPWKKQVDRAAKISSVRKCSLRLMWTKSDELGQPKPRSPFWAKLNIFPSHVQKFSNRGRLEPGDKVIQVRKFEQTQVDSNLFRLTDKEFPVCAAQLGPWQFCERRQPQRRGPASSSPRFFGFTSARWWLRIASSRLSAESRPWEIYNRKVKSISFISLFKFSHYSCFRWGVCPRALSSARLGFG